MSCFVYQSQPECSQANDVSAVLLTETGYEQNHVFCQVQIHINRNADDYFREFLHTPLKIFLPGTAKIAGVMNTIPLTESKFPEIGSRRQVFLKDGESAKEQVLEMRTRHFRYKVSDYTLKSARPIEYGIGEFWFEPLTEDITLIHWKYSFKLKDNIFPGNLGWLGRTLFKWVFIDSDYAEFMETGINAIKRHAERDLNI